MKTLLIAAAFLYAAGPPLDNADLDAIEGVITEYTKTACEVDKTFDMESRVADARMWSTRCKDGRDFIITVLSDGKIGLVSCEEAKTVGAVCWKTFEEQEKNNE